MTVAYCGATTATGAADCALDITERRTYNTSVAVWTRDRIESWIMMGIGERQGRKVTAGEQLTSTEEEGRLATAQGEERERRNEGEKIKAVE